MDERACGFLLHGLRMSMMDMREVVRRAEQFTERANALHDSEPGLGAANAGLDDLMAVATRIAESAGCARDKLLFLRGRIADRDSLEWKTGVTE